MRIFKYVSMKSAILIVESRTLRCAAPATFNDPFELQVFPMSRPVEKEQFIDELVRQFCEMQANGERVSLAEMHIKSPIKSLVALYHASELDAKDDEAFIVFLRQWLSERSMSNGPSDWTRLVHRRIAHALHVCCFSANSSSLLMWSHYADHHRGVILEFESDGPPSLLRGVRQVRYVDDFPHEDDLEESAASNLGRPRKPERAQEILDQMLFTKSTEWSYEAEWRVLLSASEELVSYRAFPDKSLVSIHVGCRCDRDAAWELALVAKKLNPALEVYSRSLDPTGFRLLTSLVVAANEIPEAAPEG